MTISKYQRSLLAIRLIMAAPTMTPFKTAFTTIWLRIAMTQVQKQYFVCSIPQTRASSSEMDFASEWRARDTWNPLKAKSSPYTEAAARTLPVCLSFESLHSLLSDCVGH